MFNTRKEEISGFVNDLFIFLIKYRLWLGGFLEGLKEKKRRINLLSSQRWEFDSHRSFATSDTAEADRVPRAAYDSSSNTSFTRS